MAPVFPNSIKSGQFPQTKIVEEQIPISPANSNSITEQPLMTSESLVPSPIIRPQSSNYDTSMTLLSFNTGVAPSGIQQGHN